MSTPGYRPSIIASPCNSQSEIRLSLNALVIYDEKRTLWISHLQLSTYPVPTQSSHSFHLLASAGNMTLSMNFTNKNSMTKSTITLRRELDQGTPGCDKCKTSIWVMLNWTLNIVSFFFQFDEEVRWILDQRIHSVIMPEKGGTRHVQHINGTSSLTDSTLLLQLSTLSPLSQSQVWSDIARTLVT